MMQLMLARKRRDCWWTSEVKDHLWFN